MKNLVTVLLTSALFSAPAYAWKETGGGDEVALDFQRAFSNAVGAVSAGKVVGNFTAEDLQKTAKDARILVVEDRLLVTLSGITQESIATNQPGKGLIQINRARWTNLKDERLKEAVALHEVLSLRRIERTGDYSYSARYLEAFGLSPWLISGAKKDRSLDPQPKKLRCEIIHDGTPETFPPETHIVEEMTAETGQTAPRSLDVRKTITTNNGRFEIYLWAVQPFRNAYLPDPHEFTSITIVDKKLNVSTGAGPGMVADAKMDMPDSKAQYTTFSDSRMKIADIYLTVDCTLN